ncbi:putative DNA mismatch repair protein [Lyophyllum shimeji]|uniref:DNA mismatch repair protein n=1 Tax=Lyophyllum shimeji TaxID=47721 RepID=A0A9P3PZ80_LYOSH|nr:putative DNA mismatch repair protein [Lyophyllum shimeji]
MERCRIFRTSLANCHNSGGVDNARAYCSHEIRAESPGRHGRKPTEGFQWVSPLCSKLVSPSIFYVNGRPCNLTKIRKAFNEVYCSFNANQAPFILADFILPTDSVDVNVSPDKRTIFVHSEGNLIVKLKAALEEAFAPSRSMYDVGGSQSQQKTQSTLAISTIRPSTHKRTRLEFEDVELVDEEDVLSSTSRKGPGPPSPSLLANHATSEEPLFLSEDIDVESHQPSASSVLSSRPYAPAVRRTMSPTVSQMVDPYVAPRTELRGRRSPSSPVQPASPTVTQMIDERRSRKDDAMHVDDEDHPPVDRAPSPAVVPGRAASVVIDTTAAAWSAVARPAKDIEVELVEDERGPARKKWKSELSFGVSSVGQGGVRTGALAKKLQRTESSKKPRDDLRNKLVGFARMGSHIPASRAHEEDDDEEDVGYTYGGRGAYEDEAEDDELDPSSDVEQSIENSAGLRHDEPRSLATRLSPIVGDEIGQSSSKAIDLTSDDGLDDARVPPIFEDTSSSSLRQDDPISRPEVIRTTDKGHGDITLRLDLSRISDTWRRLHDEIASAFDDVSLPAEGRVPKDASLANTENNAGAADALARVIEKRDFAEMEIVGQFNLGFIVARRCKTGPAAAGEGGSAEGAAEMDDLFIVDQHAADEKYSFETLQQTTSIKSQRLFKPQAMELTASDELLALENMDVLRQNGFEVEEADVDEVSKSTVFDMKDLEELVHLLRDRPTGQMVRCSKARAMFAMRARRKSVMVGMPLNKQQMSLVVSHMGPTKAVHDQGCGMERIRRHSNQATPFLPSSISRPRILNESPRRAGNDNNAFVDRADIGVPGTRPVSRWESSFPPKARQPQPAVPPRAHELYSHSSAARVWIWSVLGTQYFRVPSWQSQEPQAPAMRRLTSFFARYIKARTVQKLALAPTDHRSATMKCRVLVLFAFVGGACVVATTGVGRRDVDLVGRDRLDVVLETTRQDIELVDRTAPNIEARHPRLPKTARSAAKRRASTGTPNTRSRSPRPSGTSSWGGSRGPTRARSTSRSGGPPATSFTRRAGTSGSRRSSGAGM